MKIQYFQDTDTLYIAFRDQAIHETREMDENTLIDLDERGNVCGITFEHASERTDLNDISMEGVAA